MTAPAIMTAAEVAAAYDAALERKNEGRRQEYVAYSEAEELRAKLEGRKLDKVSIYAPEHKAAASAADFWDDRIIERASALGMRGFPETPLLITIAVALRDGRPGDALTALRAAGQLDPDVQWAVRESLRLWRAHGDAHQFGAYEPIGRVLAEWSRLGLQDMEPRPGKPARRRQRPWEVIETEATA